MPFCMKCGTEVSDKTVLCGKCGASCTLTASGDPVIRMLMPIGRSGWAIAAGYLALFSLLIFPAPFALAAGIIALKDIKKHPEKHGRGRAWFGVVMGAVFSLLLLAGVVASLVG